jgi:1-phosphatidylinositol-4-phosphate 5-kinase
MENPNTFITRFYGMHRVKPHKSDEKHFIIMGSVFNTPLYVHVVYDLKGSSQGRSATEVLYPDCQSSAPTSTHS